MINSEATLRGIRSQRHIKFIYLFSTVGAVSALIFGIIHIVQYQNYVMGSIEIFASIVSILNLILLYTTHNEHITSSIVMLLMYGLLMSILTYGGFQNTGLVWFATYPALAYGMKNHQTAHGWLFALLCGIFLHTTLASLQLIPGAYTIAQAAQLSVALLSLSCLIAIRKYYTEKDEEQLTKQLEEISLMNTVLEKAQANESELQSELLRYKLAFDRSYDFMTMTDPKGIILYANAAVERVTGFTQKEIIGTKAGSLWGKQMPSEFYQQMWKTIHIEKKEFIGEFENKRKNGQSYLAKVTITPVIGVDDNVSFFIGIERDITKEKELETAKSEFLSFAAHQLRTPVTAIKWYVQMLQDGTAGNLSPEQKNIAHKIELTNQRMNELMHEFLNISRLESGHLTILPKSLKVQEFCQELQQEVAPLLSGKQIKLEIKVSKPDQKIRVDEGLCRQILINFLTNAIKYTPPNRTITLSSEDTPEGTKLSVHDTGIGIPLAEQQNIFSKFFRAENARLTQAEGSGLGLYFIKKIVDLAGGKVGFESKIGEGSTFYIIVPSHGWQQHEGVVSIGEQEV